MEERVKYLAERLEAISPYYFKGMGGKLTLLRHALEELQEGDSCEGFDPIFDANEAYLWVAEKYKGIGEKELSENPETMCLQDVPRHIAELGQKYPKHTRRRHSFRKYFLRAFDGGVDTRKGARVQENYRWLHKRTHRTGVHGVGMGIQAQDNT